MAYGLMLLLITFVPVNSNVIKMDRTRKLNNQSSILVQSNSPEICKVRESPNVISYMNCKPLKVNLTYCHGSCQSVNSTSFSSDKERDICRLCKPSKVVKVQLNLICNGTVNTDVSIDRIVSCHCDSCKSSWF